jgi:carnitine-CoA ligase
VEGALTARRAALLRRWLERDDGSLVDVLRSRAERSPAEPLLRDEASCLTNADVLDQCEHIAGFLRGAGGWARGCAVASYLTTRIDEHLWRLATNLAGGVYVSLNRDYRGAMLSDLLQRSDPVWLVTEHAALPTLAALDALPHVRGVVVVDGPADARVPHGVAKVEGGHCLAAPRWSGASPDALDCASVLFTSGTTGRPKAARLPHSLFVRGGSYLAAAWGLGERDAFHSWAPAYHVGGQLYQLGIALLAGASCVVFPTFSRSRFWSQVARFGCTYTGGFGNLATYLLANPPASSDRGHTLRVALLAGVRSETRHTFERRFGVTCVDSYGMTEAEPVAASIAGRSPAGCCGPVNPDFDLRIVDSLGQRVGPETTGRVLLRPLRAGVAMLGYREDDGSTVPAECDADGWLRTRDLGYLDRAGNFHFVDRERNALKRRGENVSPREVELAICRAPNVKDCAVTGVWLDEGAEPELKVVLAAEPGRQLDPAHVAVWCGQELPKYMVPRFYQVLPALPYTEVGKVDIARLCEATTIVWDGAANAVVPDPCVTQGLRPAST